MAHRYALDGAERPSQGVVAAMTESMDCSPFELEPLGEATDPQALDAIVATSSEPEVRFRYCGATVTVTADAVRIGERREAAENS